MLVWPISSPKMTRMLGLRPDGGGCGDCCACAVWVRSTALIAVTSDVPASRWLRRLNALSFDDFELPDPFALLSPGILLSYFTMKTDNYFTAGFLLTQRNPRWLVDVSTASA